MIELGEILNLSIKSIWRNKVRSTLTMLGIIIGVAAVIILISVGQGLQKYITGQFDTLGANLIYIMPGNVLDQGIGHGPPNLAGSKLTLKHVEGITRLGGAVKMQLQIQKFQPLFSTKVNQNSPQLQESPVNGTKWLR